MRATSRAWPAWPAPYSTLVWACVWLAASVTVAMLKPSCWSRSETLRARPVTVVPLSTATLTCARCALVAAVGAREAGVWVPGGAPTALGLARALGLLLPLLLPPPPPARLATKTATTTMARTSAPTAISPPRPSRAAAAPGRALARGLKRAYVRGGIVAEGAAAARTGWAGRGGIGGAGLRGREPAAVAAATVAGAVRGASAVAAAVAAAAAPAGTGAGFGPAGSGADAPP